MAVGSTYSAVKAQLVAKLLARPALSGVAVTYRPPEKAAEVEGQSGSGETIWLDDAEGDNEVVIFGGLPLHFDESYALVVKIQVLRPETGTAGEQQAADTRADELLYEVLKELASDPSLGVAGFDHVQVIPASWVRTTGHLGTSGGHAASIDLSLQVEARIGFS